MVIGVINCLKVILIYYNALAVVTVDVSNKLAT